MHPVPRTLGIVSVVIVVVCLMSISGDEDDAVPGEDGMTAVIPAGAGVYNGEEFMVYAGEPGADPGNDHMAVGGLKSIAEATATAAAWRGEQ